jgi:hypothetical protein
MPIPANMAGMGIALSGNRISIDVHASRCVRIKMRECKNAQE